MNMFFREVRIHIRPLVIWSLVMLFYIFVAMVKFDASLAAGESMAKLIEAMPRIFQSMLGLGYFDLNTPIGYFGAAYLYLMLFGAIHGGMLGASILAAEERDKTSEFLMVRPVTRSRVISAKLSASALLILLFNVVVYVVSVLVLNSYGDGAVFFFEVLKLSSGFLAVEVIFFSIGFFFSSILKNPKFAPSLTAFVLMAALIFSVLGEYLESLSFLRYFSPFSYFDAKMLLGLTSLNLPMLVLGLLLPLVLLPLSYYFYNRRDLNI